MSDRPHVLIVGAGMTGLLLAQKLKSHGISFSIYERDPSADCRGGGWGLAIHWALDVLLALLPEHLREQIPQTNVDPDALAEGRVGRFPFFNLVTGETRFENKVDETAKTYTIHIDRCTFPQWDGLDATDNIAVTENELKITPTRVIQDPTMGPFVPHINFKRAK